MTTADPTPNGAGGFGGTGGGAAGVVLVVDDSPDTLRFLTAMLERADVTVLVARDGVAALDLLAHVTPDLILMDAIMPGLDGFATTRRIKADPRLRHLPIIFMTGLTETGHVVEGFAAGCVDYVAKPIVIDELLARLRVHLANARVVQGSQTALDVSGRPVFALDQAGVPCWFTPLATSMLERLFPGWSAMAGHLPEELAVPLKRLLTGDPAMQQITLMRGETRLDCTVLRRVDRDEWLFRLQEKRAGDQERVLAERHGLTSREAQVLLWISCGKQNREVGEILDISPRTVSKHLEQIFQKIGVENRASAAGVAVSTLRR